MFSQFQNWSDLRVFLAVYRAGSSLAASKDLNMTQPTVARRIETLEQVLGVALFERNTRGFKPTPAALSLLPQAEAVETAATQFSEAAKRLSATTAQTIRLTAIESSFTTNFSRIFEDFAASNAEVRFEFIPSNDRIDVSNGDVDIALRWTDQALDPKLICRKMTVISHSLLASRNYADKHPLPKSEAEFAGHKFVVFDDTAIPHAANRWLLQRIAPDRIAMTCRDMPSLETAVLMGAGIGPLPTPVVHRRGADLVECFQLPAENDTPCWLLVNPTAYRRPEVKAFTAFFAPRYSALFRAD